MSSPGDEDEWRSYCLNLMRDGKTHPKLESRIGRILHLDWLTKLAKQPGNVFLHLWLPRGADQQYVSKVLEQEHRGKKSRSIKKDLVHVERDVYRFYRTSTKDAGYVAVKVFRQRTAAPSEKRALQLQAVRTWSELDHPNIVPLLSFVDYTSTWRNASRKLCLVSPWLSAGNVMDYVKAHPDADRIDIIVDLADALHYLHGRSPPVIHGNIRGNNVLIDIREGRPRALLTDIGLSDLRADGSRRICVLCYNSQGGPFIRWIAPERMAARWGGLACGANASTGSDVFEMCRTIFEIITGQPPFTDLKRTSLSASVHVPDIMLTRRVLDGKYPERPSSKVVPWLTDGLWGLLLSGWTARADARPSAEGLYALLLMEGLLQLSCKLSQDNASELSTANANAYLPTLETNAQAAALSMDGNAPGFIVFRKCLDSPMLQLAIAKVIEAVPARPLSAQALQWAMLASELESIEPYGASPFQGIVENISLHSLVRTMESAPSRDQVPTFELMWKIIQHMTKDGSDTKFRSIEINALLPLITRQLSRLSWTFPNDSAKNESLRNICFGILNLRPFWEYVVASLSVLPAPDEDESDDETRISCRRLWELVKSRHCGDTSHRFVMNVVSALSISQLVRKVLHASSPLPDRRNALDDIGFVVDVFHEPNRPEQSTEACEVFQRLLALQSVWRLSFRNDAKGQVYFSGSPHMRRALEKLNLLHVRGQYGPNSVTVCT